jgi:magnesium-transporting ATPase (P-type)
MCAMPDTAGPKCVICEAPAKWFCAFCGSNCFCDEHVCNHIVRDHQEEFGLKPNAKQREQQEKQRAVRFILIALLVIFLVGLLIWMWSQPSSGNSETMRVNSLLNPDSQSKRASTLPRTVSSDNHNFVFNSFLISSIFFTNKSLPPVFHALIVPDVESSLSFLPMYNSSAMTSSNLFVMISSLSPIRSPLCFDMEAPQRRR